MEKTPTCVDCGMRGCDGKGGEHPSFCLSKAIDADELAETMALYDDEENRRVMEAAADVEYRFYGRYTRVQETIEFAHRMGFARIGIATCAALAAESQTLRRLLEAAGFEVFGVICKIGEQRKVDFGLDPAMEAVGANLCNPIMQAKLLEDAGTELNIVMGLCVGHDALFSKHSRALTTTLVAKDRVTGHNPCVVLHTADTLYRKRLLAQIEGYAREDGSGADGAIGAAGAGDADEAPKAGGR